MSSCRPITACRLCGNTRLTRIIDVGEQALTGVFPKNPNEKITRGPLVLVKCDGGDEVCGLVQLEHDYDLAEMYGENYGYRSSLNRMMVEHLRSKVEQLIEWVPLKEGDVVLDIGSNDGTTLGCYPEEGLTHIGIDPTANKFAQYYKPYVKRAAEFFNAAAFKRLAPGKKAKIITSISMFYDLPRPLDFVRDIAEILADDGVWHCEQSYVLAMMDACSYDTICHEHVEYYALRQIQWMAERVGLHIIHVEFNDVNGGSFAVTLAKRPDLLSGLGVKNNAADVLADEKKRGLHTMMPYQDFAALTEKRRVELLDVLARLKKEGKRVFGLGASTKGNVVLQYCGLTSKDIEAIGDVNKEKDGAYTPGSLIPIISEQAAHERDPDVFLILPWHFRKGFLQREAQFMKKGGKLLFHLPAVELVSAPE